MKTKILVVAVNLGIIALLVFGAEWAAFRVQTSRLGPGSSNPQTVRDRWSGWRNNARFGRVDIAHNEQGFRHSAPVTKAKPAGTIRIFFTGGSAAYGCEGLLTEVDDKFLRLYNNQLVDHYLEQQLQAKYPGKRFEVINAATNMFRIHQTQAAIQSRLLDYQPDLIISMDGHNDASGIMSSKVEPYNPYEETSDAQEFDLLANPDSGKALLFQFSTWLRNKSALYTIVQRRMKRFGGSEFDLPKGPARQVSMPVAFEVLTPQEQTLAKSREHYAGYIAKACRRVAGVLREEKIPVLFALQPELILSGKKLAGSEPALRDHCIKLFGPYGVYMYERLFQVARTEMAADAEHGLYGFTDLTHSFDGESGQTFTDYCHLTPRGNEQIATRLVPEIEKILALKP